MMSDSAQLEAATAGSDTLTSMDSEATDYGTNEEIIQEIVSSELTEHKHKLEQVKQKIEDKFQKSLSHIDEVYIDSKYIEELSKLWLKEITDALQKLADDKSGDSIRELLSSLDSIRGLSDVPDPFKGLQYYKLLRGHSELVPKEDEKSLLDRFKEECWQQTVDYSETAAKELHFLRTFVDLLSSSRNLQSLIVELELKGFCDGKSSFEGLLQRILKLDESSHGASVVALQEAADYLQQEEDLFLIATFKEVIGAYIKPTTIENKEIDNRSVIEVKGKNVAVSEILPELEARLSANSKIEEVRFVAADVMHVDRDFRNEIWHGKNIVILTNTMKIHSEVTWNVSGMNNTRKFSRNAGTGPDGHGLHGADGQAGESGGNVLILAKTMENPAKLTITSYGGDGSNGQDGGDGKKGEDGKGIESYKFDEKFPSVVPTIGDAYYRDAIVDKLRQTIRDECSTVSVDYYGNKDFYLAGERQQGNNIYFGYYSPGLFTVFQAYLLYTGSDGKSGGNGGEYGLGGQGGYAGEIIVRKPESGQEVNIAQNSRHGKNGDNGKGGLYGEHGKNGWDMGYLDYQMWKGTWYFGRDQNSKITLHYSDKKGSDAIWCPYNKQYVRLIPGTIEHRKNAKYEERRTTRQQNERQHTALAVRKKAISQSSILTSYSQYFGSIEQNILQNLRSDVESTKERALGAITDLQLQVAKQTTELSIQRHVSSTTQAARKRPNSVASSASYKDTTNADGLIDRLNGEPQLLDNWLELRGTEVAHSDLNKLIAHFEAIKSHEAQSAIEPGKLGTIEELLINKYGLATVHEIAKQLPPYPLVANPIELTPGSAARYLIEDKERDADISHPTLGTLHQYLYQNTKEHHEKISKFNKEKLQSGTENIGILRHSLRRFILQMGISKEAHPSIQKYYDEYRLFSERHERSLEIFVEAFMSELSRPRHAAVYELWNKGSGDKSLKTKLEEKVQEDPFLRVLYGRYKKELNLEYGWDKCCKDQTVLKEHSDHIREVGPFSASYRELLAYAFGINIRLYGEDENNALYLQDNHNPTAKKSTHILCRSATFVQLTIDEDYLRLEEQRRINDSKYAQIFVEIDSLKRTAEFDEYLKKQSFLRSKEYTNISQSVYDEDGDIRQIIDYFSGEERQQLEVRLEKIKSQYVGQQGILHNILQRFSNEGRHVSCQELCFLINSIISSCVEERKEQATFCWIVRAYSQKSWIDELLLLHLENYFRKPLAMKSKLREHLLEIGNIGTLLLLNVKLDQCRADTFVSTQSIEEILRLLSSIPKEAVLNLEGLQLPEWSYALKERYWTSKLSKLMDWPGSDLPTASYYLLSMEYTFGMDQVEQFTEILKDKTREINPDRLIRILSNFHNEEWTLSEGVLKSLGSLEVNKWQKEMQQKFSSVDRDRDIEQLVEVIDGNANTSKGISGNLANIKESVRSINNKGYVIAGKPVGSLTNEDIKNWTKELRGNIEKRKQCTQEEMFAVIDQAIQLQRGWRLRDTQRLTTWVLLTNKLNTLAQVATGEGKSIIVVALSIMKALSGQKVDIVTSSSVLAKRDAEENKDIYDLFDISVSHNCSEAIDKRKAAYSGSQVVYGDLSNFQRDYLLDTFYGKNILGDRHFENVVVDEVDSMLLDRGNNMLYLSHELPGLDKLESLYIYIWQWLNRPAKEPEDIFDVFDTKAIKEAVLNDLYGLVKREDIGRLDSELTGLQKNTIYERLIKAELLDDQGMLLRESVDDIKLNEVLSPEFIKYKDRLGYLFKESFGRERRIHVPNYLRPFIERHLESWIENAKIAFFMKSGLDYVVDVDRTGSSSDRSPNITILDRDTGTDQANSQWDEALHQFLQLKHGCKLSLQSLKAVFVSSVTYFKLYRNLYGLTGTLGSQRERDLLQEIHNVDFVTIPTSKSKQFVEHKPIICTNTEDWTQKVRGSVQKLTETRSVLVICETVNDVEILHKAFGGKGARDVHTYTRDYEAFDLAKGSKKLEKGHVIIATNLAGRGTDIKITKELERAGGLHVCLTYLPNNIRIEQQAFGRAARKGEKGSGQLVVLDRKGEHSSNSTIFDLRKDGTSEEIYRLSVIKAYYETQITVEEKCFQAFKELYEQLSTALTGRKVPGKITEILLQSCLDKWAFWLDENGKHIKDLIDEQSKRRFQDQLHKFISQLKMPIIDHDSNSWLAWVGGHPAQMIELGKRIAQADKKEHKNAIALFEEVIKKEPYFSEAAHYYKAFVLAKQIDWERKPVDEAELKEFKNALREAAVRFDERRESAIIAAGIVGKIKTNNSDSIIQIDAYEEQQKSMANLYSIFVQSIDDILGHAVSPKLFNDNGVNDELSGALYEDFLQEGILKKPRVKKDISDEKLKGVSSGYGVSVDPLKRFLSVYDDGRDVIDKEFQKSLKEAVPLPGREEFWRSLLEQDILTEDIKYITVDGDKLAENDSKLFALLTEKIGKEELKRQTLEPNKDEIFLKAELISLEESSTLIFEKVNFVESLGRDKYLVLKTKGVLSSNRKARVDTSKVPSATFPNYDSIGQDDFAMLDIARSDAEQIVAELLGQNVIVKGDGSQNDDYRLQIQYDEIEEIVLTSCPVYETAVKGLLTASFAYRIALQRIVRQLEENDFPVRLHLVTKPHQSLYSELLEQKIIRQIPSTSSREDIEDALKKVLSRNSLKLAEHTVESITNDLDASRGTLETLEVPDSKLKALIEICGECDFGNIEEVKLFSLNGLDLVLQMEEKKWTRKMILSTALVIAMGVAQIAIGTAIELYSVGTMTNVGAAFLSEGIGDICFAISALRSGYFSWKDYAKQKIESLIITAATAGVGALISKFSTVSRFGHKLAGPVFAAGGAKVAGLKVVGREIVKRTIITTMKKVSLSIANEGVDMVLENGIKALCSNIATAILSDIQKQVQEHDVAKSLEKAYKVLGAQSAEKMVNHLSQHFFSAKTIGTYLINIFKEITFNTAEKIGKLAKHTSTSVKLMIKTITKGVVWTKKLIQIVEILNLTSTFLNAVNRKINSTLEAHPGQKQVAVAVAVAGTATVEKDVDTFKAEVIAKWKLLLRENVGELIKKYIVTPILEKGVDLIGRVGKRVKEAYKTRKESGYLQHFEKIKKEYHKGLQDSAGPEAEHTAQPETHITEKYHTDMQRLMMKTKSPKLFAAIVRENIPMDIACVGACTKVVHKLLKQQGGGGGLTIVVEGPNGIRQSFSSGPAGGVVVRLKFEGSHFQLSESGTLETNANAKHSLYEALSEAIPELKNVTSEDFRDRACHLIEHDDDVQEYIRKRWLPASPRKVALELADPTDALHPHSNPDNTAMSPHANDSQHELASFQRRKQTASKKRNSWHGELGGLDRPQSKHLKKIDSLDFTRSLTAECADTIKSVKKDFMAELDKKINQGNLDNREKAELMKTKTALADMKIEELFGKAREHYTFHFEETAHRTPFLNKL